MVGDNYQALSQPRHRSQQLIDFRAFGDEHGLIEQLTHIEITPVGNVCANIAAYPQHTDDIVDAALIDRDPAVILLLDKIQDLLRRFLNINGGDVDAGSQDALNSDIIKLKRR